MVTQSGEVLSGLLKQSTFSTETFVEDDWVPRGNKTRHGRGVGSLESIETGELTLRLAREIS